MNTKQKTLAVAGAGIAAAAALGLTGATLAGATEVGAMEIGAASAVVGSGNAGDGETARPGPGHGGMRDAGGTLTADAASKAIAAAEGEVDGGTVSGVRALSTGAYVVHVHKSDGTHVHVLVDATFAVTAVEEGGMGRGGRGMPAPEGDDPTGSTDPSDGNESATSAPTT
jgi:hypothetical protein